MTTSATQRRARTPQTERVETTQRKIIDSALALLREGGFKSATLQAIARGADVSLGALQHHFESRDALMERLVIEVMEPLSDQGTVWPDKALPLRERAEAFVTLAWDNIFGAANYQAAWSMFFGCKASPSLFDRVDARRRLGAQILLSSAVTRSRRRTKRLGHSRAGRSTRGNLKTSYSTIYKRRNLDHKH